MEAEIRAQIELALKKIPHVSHVTSHMGWTGMDPRIKDLIQELTQEYSIDIAPADYGVKRVRYEGPKNTEKEKFESFSQMLKILKNGETYLFVDHPAFDTEEQRAVNHIGYSDVAVDRDGVAKIWTNPGIKDLIDQLGIKLISYKDLKNFEN